MKRPFVAFALSCAAMIPACAKHEPLQELPASRTVLPSVRVVRPSTTLDVGTGKVTGAIRSKREATLAAKVTAQIVRLEVTVGDTVKAGQLIAQLDVSGPSNARNTAMAAKRLAETSRAFGESELVRAKALYESGASTKSALDRAQNAVDMAVAQLAQADAAVRTADQQIADATLRAPFAGIVASKFKNAGDTVSSMPPTAIVALVDPDDLEVRASVPEALVPFTQPGAVLHGTLNPSGTALEAKVRVVSAVIDTASRTVEIFADLARKPEFRPGALVTLDLSGFGTTAGIFVPTGAIRRDGAKAYVLVVENGEVRRRDVVVVPVSPGIQRVVDASLREGEQVALDPSGTLRVGDHVSVLSPEGAKEPS